MRSLWKGKHERADYTVSPRFGVVTPEACKSGEMGRPFAAVSVTEPGISGPCGTVRSVPCCSREKPGACGLDSALKNTCVKLVMQVNPEAVGETTGVR